jgi:hypothetical protein
MGERKEMRKRGYEGKRRWDVVRSSIKRQSMREEHLDHMEAAAREKNITRRSGNRI